jgi:hypothetical protein
MMMTTMMTMGMVVVRRIRIKKTRTDMIAMTTMTMPMSPMMMTMIQLTSRRKAHAGP